MCLPPISRGAPGKSPPSSSSSTSSTSTGPKKRRRRGEDEVATRVAAATSSGSTGKHLRSSAPVRRGKDGGVDGGPRRTSTRGRERGGRDRDRDTSRLAPPRTREAMESPLPSPAFSEKRSSSKRHHHSSASASTSTRRRRSESQTSTPRTPATATFQKERKSRKKPTDMIQKEQIITMQAPLQGGGTISGLVVIRPGSSSESGRSGTSKSSSRERSSESSNTSKATTLVASGAGTVGLGISLESSRALTPTSKGRVERFMEIEQVEQKVAQVTVPIPKIEVEEVKEVVNEPVKLMRVIPPPAPAPVPPAPAPAHPLPPASIPQSKAAHPPPPPPASIPQPKAAPPVETYPIMATLVYPTKESLAYQPISRYQVTSKITSTIPNPPAVRATPLVIDPANVRLPPSMLKYQNTSPTSSVHELPLHGSGTPALSISQQSSLSSLVSTSTASSAASASSIKEPSPKEPLIQYLNSTASSSTSSLVSASSTQSFQSVRPPTPQQKVNYYRYAAVATTPAHRPLKAIMDSPRLPRAGSWDGMPGADPNLGAYYRNAAVAAGKPKPTQPAAQKEGQVDLKTLAAYYANAKQKTALERVKYERSDESETEASDESASEISAISSQHSYYRARTTTIIAPEPDNTLALSPTNREHTTIIAGHKVFISTLRRSAPQVFHTARPPPAPTPPPAGGAASAVGDEDEEGPPEGSAENWFRGMKEQMGKDTGVKEGWADEEDEVVVPEGIPPPAPTPPLAREEEEIHLDNGYYGSPRMPYGYQR